MEDELSLNRTAFATPSVDPLDAALAKLTAERPTTGQEPGKDVTTRTVTTADTNPDDDDFEDDDDTVVANTPDVTDDDDDDDSLDVQQKQTPDDTSTPGDKTKGEGKNSDDSDQPRSRKQRGKLIEELRADLEREQQEKRDLEDRIKKQEDADAALNTEVDRALGTDDEFKKATDDGLNGDTKAAERARIWTANREFYKKLLDKSKRDGTSQFMNTYWQEVSGLPGVKQEALQAPTLSAILKNLYDAGVASVKETSTEEVDKLKADVDTWRGRYRALKARAGGSKTSPLGGGGSTAVEQVPDWRRKYIDPKTGLLTNEADAIVAQFGYGALADPKLRKG